MRTVHKEPDSFAHDDPEDCSECGKPTRWWLDIRTPLCQSCAKYDPMTPEQKATHQILVQEYIAKGYTERHDFPHEYALLLNRFNLNCARVYEDGSVWEKGLAGPEYVKIREKGLRFEV